MDKYFFEHIPFETTKEEILLSMGMPVDHRLGDQVLEAIELAKDIINPKAAYGEATIEARTEDTVTIDGIVFHGRYLVNTLKDVDTVYPYICTCGKEIDRYYEECGDILKQLFLDKIMHFALRQAAVYLSEEIDNRLGKRSACITPGSFEEWELTEQRPLFSLLGECVSFAEIRLSDSNLMFPVKSVSGFRFKAGKEAHDCRLCLKRDCADREAAFDLAAYETTLC